MSGGAGSDSGGTSGDRGVSTVRVVVGAVLVLSSVVGGAYAAGLVGMPTVTGVENRFAAVDEETTTIETEVGVRNPNVFAIGLGGVSVDYTVELNEVRLADGHKEGVNLSTGNATVAFRTAMENGRIPKWWTAHIRDGESSDLVVTATVHSSTLDRSATLTPVEREVSTDLLSAFNSSETRPVNASQPVVSDPVLYVNETRAHWGDPTEAETPIEMAFDVYNPKSAPYAVTAIGYEITMNGVGVGSGESDRAYTIPPGATRTVRATTIIENPALDEWWVSHLRRNQVTDLRIDFYARIELPTGNEIRVPLDALTYTETMETDVFGTKNETGGASGTATPAGGDGSTTADDGGAGGTDDGSTSPTPTESSPTPTEDDGSTTPTPTPTETDGGLLG